MSCFHRLLPFNKDKTPDSRGIRYFCATCGKELKILSGYLVPEDEIPPVWKNRWWRGKEVKESDLESVQKDRKTLGPGF